MGSQRASINLRNILDVSEKEQLVSMETTLRLFWKVSILNVYCLMSFFCLLNFFLTFQLFKKLKIES